MLVKSKYVMQPLNYDFFINILYLINSPDVIKVFIMKFVINTILERSQYKWL